MKKIMRFLILLTIVSLSCNLLTGEGGFAEVTGPILAILPAASLDERGEIVGQAYSFAPTAPQVAVVIQVGELDAPASLSVTWYLVSDAGEERLFEHSIEVDSLDRAYSIGENPGLLASGTYKAVAALGDAVQTVTWIVAGEESEPQEGSAADASTAQSPAGSTPKSGASGKIRPPVVWVTAPGGCRVEVSISQAPPIVTGDGQATSENTGLGPEICLPLGEMEVMAWIGDNSPSRACSFVIAPVAIPVGMVHEPYALGGCPYSGDPCRLDGGSDLPGTIVNVSLRQKQSDQVLTQQTLVLSEDRLAPKIVQLISEPSNRAPVEAGQEIVLTAIAEDIDGGSWWTGVSKIVIQVMNPSPVAPFSVSYDKKSCKEKSLQQKTKPEYKYKVPKGVKGDVKICAFAEDFAGNKSPEKCYTYPTGKQLKGTLNHSIQEDGPTASAGGIYTHVETQDADLSLTLEPGGTLSGTAQNVYAMDILHFQSESCGNVREWVDPTPLTLPVSGTWTEDVIDFNFTIDAPVMVTKNFEAIADCGGTGSQQLDLAYLVGYRFHAVWDGQAYTVDEMYDCTNNTGITCVTTLKIRLEPPAPAVGFSPGAWEFGSGDQASLNLTYP